MQKILKSLGGSKPILAEAFPWLDVRNDGTWGGVYVERCRFLEEIRVVHKGPQVVFPLEVRP